MKRGFENVPAGAREAYSIGDRHLQESAAGQVLARKWMRTAVAGQSRALWQPNIRPPKESLFPTLSATLSNALGKGVKELLESGSGSAETKQLGVRLVDRLGCPQDKLWAVRSGDNPIFSQPEPAAAEFIMAMLVNMGNLADEVVPNTFPLVEHAAQKLAFHGVEFELMMQTLLIDATHSKLDRRVEVEVDPREVVRRIEAKTYVGTVIGLKRPQFLASVGSMLEIVHIRELLEATISCEKEEFVKGKLADYTDRFIGNAPFARLELALEDLGISLKWLGKQSKFDLQAFNVKLADIRTACMQLPLRAKLEAAVNEAQPLARFNTIASLLASHGYLALLDCVASHIVHSVNLQSFLGWCLKLRERGLSVPDGTVYRGLAECAVILRNYFLSELDPLLQPGISCLRGQMATVAQAADKLRQLTYLLEVLAPGSAEDVRHFFQRIESLVAKAGAKAHQLCVIAQQERMESTLGGLSSKVSNLESVIEALTTALQKQQMVSEKQNELLAANNALRQNAPAVLHGDSSAGAAALEGAGAMPTPGGRRHYTVPRTKVPAVEERMEDVDVFALARFLQSALGGRAERIDTFIKAVQAVKMHSDDGYDAAKDLAAITSSFGELLQSGQANAAGPSSTCQAVMGAKSSLNNMGGAAVAATPFKRMEQPDYSGLVSPGGVTAMPGGSWLPGVTAHVPTMPPPSGTGPVPSHLPPGSSVQASPEPPRATSVSASTAAQLHSAAAFAVAPPAAGALHFSQRHPVENDDIVGGSLAMASSDGAAAAAATGHSEPFQSAFNVLFHPEEQDTMDADN